MHNIVYLVHVVHTLCDTFFFICSSHPLLNCLRTYFIFIFTCFTPTWSSDGRFSLFFATKCFFCFFCFSTISIICKLFVLFFPSSTQSSRLLVFLSSRASGACPVTTDLIIRVNVRTTTTTTAFLWVVAVLTLTRIITSKSDGHRTQTRGSTVAAVTLTWKHLDIHTCIPHRKKNNTSSSRNTRDKETAVSARGYIIFPCLPINDNAPHKICRIYIREARSVVTRKCYLCDT